MRPGSSLRPQESDLERSRFRDPAPLARANRRLAILSDIAARLLAGDDPQTEVLPACFEDIQEDIGIDIAFSFTPDPIAEELILTGMAGRIDNECTLPILRMPYGHGVIGQVAATRQAIHLSNIQESDDPRHAHLRARGHRAFAAEPIVKGRRLLGVLAFGSRSRASFEPEDHQFFQAVARNMGLALDRANKDAQLAECNRELQHRVKNMLSMVHAVAMLSARSSQSVGAYTDALGERLVALAKTQDLLTVENDLRAPLRGLICNELKPFDRPGRLRLKGPRVLLEPSLAVFVGMAIHELTTNAVKYGALSTPKGTIRAEWHIIEGAATRRLSLQWIERGGPPVSIPQRYGFGEMLLGKGLGNQIRATRRFRPEGVEAFIEVALD